MNQQSQGSSDEAKELRLLSLDIAIFRASSKAPAKTIVAEAKVFADYLLGHRLTVVMNDAPTVVMAADIARAAKAGLDRASRK